MFKAEHIAHLQKLIGELYGLSLGDNHLNDLLNFLRKRIAELKLDSLADYLQLIQSRPRSEELDHLVSQITVGETSFFRTPPQFWALRDFVLPEMIRRKRECGKRHFRFLSAGCATGEEPYSIAIVTLEALKSFAPAEVKIVACDVNHAFLEEARSGLYPAKDLKNLEEHFKFRYFEEKGKHFQLKKSVRELVQFVHFNLARDDFNLLAIGGHFDAIFCRNVLIYFDREVLEKIVKQFYEILEDHGCLFLGYSESLFGLNSGFDCVYVPNTFYYQKTDGTRELKHPPARKPEPLRPHGARAKPRAARPATDAASQPPARKTPAETLAADKLWEKGLELFEKEEFEKALAHFEKLAKAFPKSPMGYLGIAFVLSNQGENEQARKYLHESFKRDSLIPEGYYLLGLLAERKEEWEKAIENYQRAVFLKSDFTIAHFNLASLYFRLNEFPSAQRELKVVKQILNGSTSVYLAGGWTTQALLDWADSHLQKIQELGK